MDFFDKIRKTLLSGKEADNSADDQTSSDEDTENISDKLNRWANFPPKPDHTVKVEYGDKEYSFSLSGDYIEFNSHSDFDPSYQYEPWSDEEYTGYDGSLPIIAIGPSYTLYDAAESFENGEETEIAVTKCDSPYFLFSASFTERGDKYYAYAFASGTAYEYDMLCVTYPPSLLGTAIEKRVMADLDKAAASYKETNL